MLPNVKFFVLSKKDIPCICLTPHGGRSAVLSVLCAALSVRSLGGLYRVMRMRLKAKGHGASPRTALDLLARIHRHQARIAEKTFQGTTTPTPAQLELFDALSLPKPAR